MATKAEQIGVEKAGMNAVSMLVLAGMKRGGMTTRLPSSVEVQTPPKAWHTLAVDETEAVLHSEPDGQTAEEAASRLAYFGPNGRRGSG